MEMEVEMAFTMGYCCKRKEIWELERNWKKNEEVWGILSRDTGVQRRRQKRLVVDKKEMEHNMAEKIKIGFWISDIE